MNMLHDESQLPELPEREESGHKGTFGTVLVIGGCAADPVRMIGAPAFCALAAFRSGVGLVRLACPAPILDAAMSLCPSVTGLALPTEPNGELVVHESARVLDSVLDAADAVVLGPGMGASAKVEDVVLRVLSQERVPVVVDADALNALSRIPAVWESLRSPSVLTPHPGEWQRLADALKITLSPTDPTQRAEAATALAQRTGTIVVLKGANTVVSDGLRTWVCARSCPVLATAGTGDVLAGLVGGLIARCVPVETLGLPTEVRGNLRADPRRPLDLYDAARWGVDIHAACGQAWAATHHAQGGMLASELADMLPGELSQRARKDQ